MIPKNIYFIWIGIKPYYLNTVLSAYKQLNPEFNIQLIQYSNIQLENLYFNKIITCEIDNIIYKLLCDIFQKKRYTNLIKQLLNGAFFINHTNTAFIQIFCDILRIELLNIYGGIYIDCDTYPLKKFDDSLLNADFISVYDKFNNSEIINNYFMASSAKYKIDNYFNILNIQPYKLIQHNNQQFTCLHKNKDIDFMIRRIKFFKNKLTVNDFKNVKTDDYFEHYSEFRWGQNKIELTKFDKIFNKNDFF